MNFLNKKSISAQFFRKVPEITAYFWIIKILTTGMGEATSDFLVKQFNPMLAVAVAGIVLLISLFIQFSSRKYIAWVYWFAVAMVAVFGTMAADVLHVEIGIPYLVTTIFFVIVLVMIFFVWHATEKTLSIHSINTFRREIFYWATVLTTFALGTAAGDMTASTLHFGYFNSGILFAVLIAIVAIGHYITESLLAAEHRYQSRGTVFAFWLAYIITRPLGASFADWMGKSPRIGGLGWGDGQVALGLAFFIILFVGYTTGSKREGLVT